MQYKPFGKTGKQVSVIGFGVMRFPEEEYRKRPEKCAEVLLRAHELGVNYFDTAPGYCEDYSEDIVGYAMRQIKGAKPYVSTKCSLWNAQTAEEAYARVQKSLKRLSVDRITFQNLWCIKTLEEYREMIRPGGIYEGILRAKEEGLIEHICCSVHIDGDGLAEIVKDGRVEAVTLGYNALNFAYRRTGVKACYDAGLGVVVMNPLGGGTIPQNAEKFSFLKNDPQESVVQAALRFLIGQKEITAALPGPADIPELEECVAAADRMYEVTEETLEILAGKLKSELNTLCTGCAYCDQCPEGIPVPKLIDAYNSYLLEGDFSRVQERLDNHWQLSPEVAAKCIRCGICEPLCTQKLPIIERLEAIAGLA